MYSQLCGLWVAAKHLYRFRHGELSAKSGLEGVTEDMEKRLIMRYGETGRVQAEDEVEERETWRSTKDLKQVTESMEKRLRMRYSDPEGQVVEEQVARIERS